MNTTLLVQFIAAELPTIGDFVRALYKRKHPDETPPTNEEVAASFEKVYRDGIATDDEIIEAHRPK